MAKESVDGTDLPYSVWFIPQLIISLAFPHHVKLDPKTGRLHYSNCERNLPGTSDAWQLRMLENIKLLGVKNPIIAWGHEDGGAKISCQRGNNRCWAHMMLGRDWVPALITLPKSGRGAAMAERLSRDALHQEVRPLTHEAMLAFFDAGENVHLNLPPWMTSCATWSDI